MTAAIVVVAIGIAVSIVWTHFYGAPWVPASRAAVRRMLDLAEAGPGDVVYDLGCGDGRVIVTAARRYGARAVGIEVDPLRYLWCQLLITVLRCRREVSVRFGDFFTRDLSEADVVVCYLLPETNRRLLEKLEAELAPGARVVANVFAIEGIEPVSEDGNVRLYLPARR